MKGVWKFVGGCFVGAASALVATPKSGSELRRQVARRLLVRLEGSSSQESPPSSAAALRQDVPAVPAATLASASPVAAARDAAVLTGAPAVATSMTGIIPSAPATVESVPPPVESPPVSIPVGEPLQHPGLDDLRARIEETKNAVREALDRPFEAEAEVTGEAAEAQTETGVERVGVVPMEPRAEAAVEEAIAAEPEAELQAASEADVEVDAERAAAADADADAEIRVDEIDSAMGEDESAGETAEPFATVVEMAEPADEVDTAAEKEPQAAADVTSLVDEALAALEDQSAAMSVEQETGAAAVAATQVGLEQHAEERPEEAAPAVTTGSETEAVQSHPVVAEGPSAAEVSESDTAELEVLTAETARTRPETGDLEASSAAAGEAQPPLARTQDVATVDSEMSRTEALESAQREAETIGVGAAGLAETESVPIVDLAEQEGSGEPLAAGEELAADAREPEVVDQAEMRRRIEETRNRLKAKAFDAMTSGEAALLSRDSGREQPPSDTAVGLDDDVADVLDRSLSQDEY